MLVKDRFVAAACLHISVDSNINGQTLATVDVHRVTAFTFAVVLFRKELIIGNIRYFTTSEV